MSQIQCPKCESFKVISDRAALAAVGVGLFIFGGLFSFLLFPLVFVAAGVFCMLIAAVSKPKQFTCNNCKFKWRPLP